MIFVVFPFFFCTIYDEEYSFIGMLVHAGNDINSGTFQSIIQDKNGKWLLIENEKVLIIHD